MIKEYRKTVRRHEEFLHAIMDARDSAKRGELTLEEMTDVVYILRECNELIENMRKEADSCSNHVQQMTCVKWATAHINDPTKADPIRTELCTGTPEIRQAPHVPNPRSEPEEWAKVCKFFGIPDNAQGLVRLHWPSISTAVTKMLAEGKPLPDGVDPSRTYTVHKLRCMAKRGHSLSDITESEIKSLVKGLVKRYTIAVDPEWTLKETGKMIALTAWMRDLPEIEDLRRLRAWLNSQYLDPKVCCPET